MYLLRFLVLTGAMLGLAASAQAGTEEELDAIAKIAEDFYGNGGYGVSKYNVKKFSVTKAIRELNKSLPNDPENDQTGCQFTTTGRRTASLEALQNTLNEAEGSVAEDLVAALEKLNNAGRLRAMLSRTYAEGESEACSIYRFEIYTVDGYNLSLDFDWTD